MSNVYLWIGLVGILVVLHALMGPRWLRLPKVTISLPLLLAVAAGFYVWQWASVPSPPTTVAFPESRAVSSEPVGFRLELREPWEVDDSTLGGFFALYKTDGEFHAALVGMIEITEPRLHGPSARRALNEYWVPLFNGGPVPVRDTRIAKVGHEVAIASEYERLEGEYRMRADARVVRYGPYSIFLACRAPRGDALGADACAEAFAAITLAGQENRTLENLNDESWTPPTQLQVDLAPRGTHELRESVRKPIPAARKSDIEKAAAGGAEN